LLHDSPAVGLLSQNFVNGLSGVQGERHWGAAGNYSCGLPGFRLWPCKTLWAKFRVRWPPCWSL